MFFNFTSRVDSHDGSRQGFAAASVMAHGCSKHLFLLFLMPGSRQYQPMLQLIGPNPIDPDHLTADERLSEVASILATGVLRLGLRQRSSQTSVMDAKSSLHCVAEESVCGSDRNRSIR
jgi:hypothetical protein